MFNCQCPGCGGVTVTHISIGETDDILIDLLSESYSLMMSRNIVPDMFKLGDFAPILKKSSLNPHEAEN